MKALVIPDVHLKPWMFERADTLMREKKADISICLMDIADDWGQELNLDLYMASYDAAIRFAKNHPDTLWCYGNHDASYLWNLRESGFSEFVRSTVVSKIMQLNKTVPDQTQIAFLHRIDNVLFSHAGLSDYFVQDYVPGEFRNDIDKIIDEANLLSAVELWQDHSPIWFRPQGHPRLCYGADDFLQVVGHTPVRDITREGNVISCDVFSTYRDRTPIGTEKFAVIDTETWEFEGVA